MIEDNSLSTSRYLAVVISAGSIMSATGRRRSGQESRLTMLLLLLLVGTAALSGGAASSDGIDCDRLAPSCHGGPTQQRSGKVASSRGPQESYVCAVRREAGNWRRISRYVDSYRRADAAQT